MFIFNFTQKQHFDRIHQFFWELATRSCLTTWCKEHLLIFGAFSIVWTYGRYFGMNIDMGIDQNLMEYTKFASFGHHIMGNFEIHFLTWNKILNSGWFLPQQSSGPIINKLYCHFYAHYRKVGNKLRTLSPYFIWLPSTQPILLKIDRWYDLNILGNSKIVRKLWWASRRPCQFKFFWSFPLGTLARSKLKFNIHSQFLRLQCATWIFNSEYWEVVSPTFEF